jgi:2',3'-cyclic-nucleotide 2'-phosphodiesterase (5'-nucleotidase family)
MQRSQRLLARIVRDTIAARFDRQFSERRLAVIFAAHNVIKDILKTARRLGLILASVVALACAAFAQAPAPAPKPSPIPADVNVRTTELPVDGSVPDDQAVDKMLEAYSPKVRALDTVIGSLKGELRKGGMGAGSLGNFVTDGLLAEGRKKLGPSVVLAVTNGGGLRKSAFTEGDLRVRDIFELLPFENALVQFDLTGAQVLELLKVVLTHRDAQSGARIRYRPGANNRPELASAKLLIDGQETEIEPAKVYTVVSIDYLWKRKSTTPSETEGDYSVLSEAKKIQPLGLTMRDAMMDYVKSETAAGRSIKTNLDGRFKREDAEAPRP